MSHDRFLMNEFFYLGKSYELKGTGKCETQIIRGGKRQDSSANIFTLLQNQWYKSGMKL